MHYHLVGIIGDGLAAIAHCLLDQGHTVSGSYATVRAPDKYLPLAARGVTRVEKGFDGARIAGADALIVTSAENETNAEVMAGRAAGIPVMWRRDFWAVWLAERNVIAVSGTHGKTTTTSLIAWIFDYAGRKTGHLIGGVCKHFERPARWGDAHEPFIIEGDEHERAFLALRPQTAVLTTVDWDHPNTYPTQQDYTDAFRQFVAQAQREVLICGDAERGMERVFPEGKTQPAAGSSAPNIITYGLEAHNDYQAVPAAAQDGKQTFRIRHGNTVLPQLFTTKLAGEHNIRNALAALVVAELYGIETVVAAQALALFNGVARRFEIVGEANDITVIDDYAHHPTEIRTTLEAARQRFPGRRIIAYWQPHTYTRLEALWEEWSDAFAEADTVLVGSVFAAREVSAHGDPAEKIALEISKKHPRSHFVGGVDEAGKMALGLVKPGDVLITMSAGDGNEVGKRILETKHAAFA